MKGMIVVDFAKCTGCHTCELMCAVAHSASKTLCGAIMETPRQKPRIHVKLIGKTSVPMQCRHCKDAPCISACPSDALTKPDGENGPVLLNLELCTGCNSCVPACPFGAIIPDPSGEKVQKCDQCIEGLKADEIPGCCSGCPTGALKFVTHDKNDAGVYKVLTTFVIDEKQCKACGRCLKVCPTQAISGAKKTPHVIDQDKCVACGACCEICPFDTVATVSV